MNISILKVFFQRSAFPCAKKIGILIPIKIPISLNRLKGIFLPVCLGGSIIKSKEYECRKK